MVALTEREIEKIFENDNLGYGYRVVFRVGLGFK
jgi:hypothetical protein